MACTVLSLNFGGIFLACATIKQSRCDIRHSFVPICVYLIMPNVVSVILWCAFVDSL